MNERIQPLLAKFKETESTHRGAHVLMGLDEIEKFAELVWKAAYEEGHDVGVGAGFEAGRNASFTEQNFGVQ